MTGASFENGLLQIELVRKIPEAMKPRRIQINGAKVQGRERRQGRLTVKPCPMEEVMNDSEKRRLSNFALDELLHPAQAFQYPSEVVNDPDLTLNEKRAILASWASDACAVEASPALRTVKDGVVSLDHIMDALRKLDGEAVLIRNTATSLTAPGGGKTFTAKAAAAHLSLVEVRHGIAPCLR